MIVIDEEEALARVNSPDNLSNKLLEVRQMHHGRTGPKGIPNKMKDLMVGLSKVSSQVAVAAEFGLDQSTVDYYAERGHGQKETEQIHSAALDAMLQSIQLIPEKLKTTKKATDLSTVAANLARVVEKTSPKVREESKVKVIVYAPRVHEESEFIEVTV